jgi:hypothetical protein
MERDLRPISHLKAVDVCFRLNTFGQVSAILDRDLIRVDPKNWVVFLKKVYRIAALTTAYIQDLHVLGESTFEELVKQVVVHIA